MKLSSVLKIYERASHLKAISKVVDDLGLLAEVGNPDVEYDKEDRTATLLYIVISDKELRPVMEFAYILKEFFETEMCQTPRWFVDEILTNLIPFNLEESTRMLVNLFRRDPTNTFFQAPAFENILKNILKLKRVHQISLPIDCPMLDRNGRVLHDGTRRLGFELFPQCTEVETLWLEDESKEKNDNKMNTEPFPVTGITLRFSGDKNRITAISHSSTAYKVARTFGYVFNGFSHSIPMGVEVTDNKVIFDARHAWALEFYGKERRDIVDLLISVIKLDYKSGIDFEIVFNLDKEFGDKRNPIPLNLHGSFDINEAFKLVEGSKLAWENSRNHA